MGFRVTPASDGKVGDGGAVLGADDGKERVHGHGVFNRKGVAGV